MEQLSKWLDEWGKSPIGSGLIALAFLVLRIEIDRSVRRRERRKAAKRKGKPVA